jgi:DNA-directed RNA polymerase subunit RPC12/RpoP
MKNIRKILKEEVENYMFFQNLNTIKKHVDMLLSKSPEEMDKILKKHDWASEHMSTAKDDIEEVCNFFTDGYVSESKKKDKTIKCSGCGWSWKESESEPEDLYMCHECGKDNTPKVDEAKGPC